MIETKPINPDRLRQLMEKLGYKQASLATAIGVDQTLIGKILGRKVERTKHLPAICRVLGTTSDYLTDEIDDPGIDAAPKSLTKVMADSVADNLDAVAITELDLSLQMGGGTFFEHEIDQNQIVFSRSFIQQYTSSHASKLYAVRGAGDSMNPTIQDNDICLIDTAQNTPIVSDKIWAITHYGGGQIKRLRHVRDGYEIMSDNPNISSQLATDGEMHVIGRVVAIIRRV